MKDQLIQLAIEQVPGVIALLKDAFHKAHPGEPTPGDEEVIAAYNSAFESSLAKDEAWLAAHPEPEV